VIFLSILFWLAAFAFVTPFLLYPAGLFLLSRLKPQGHLGNATPNVTLVVSAYNEAACLEGKINNALSLTYPKDRFDIMVISDASDDGTDELVQQFAGPAARFVCVVKRSD